MLGWIPFRAKSLDGAFALLACVFDVHDYGRFSFRENFYLITVVIFVGMLLCRGAAELAQQSRIRLLRPMREIGVLAFVAFVVFIFLRPIDQFIYFQF